MKRYLAWLAALLLCVVSAAWAESSEWQADLSALMDAKDIPQICEISHDPKDEGTYEQHEVACEIKINGISYGCEFTFDVLTAVDDWSGVQSWLGEIVTSSARTAGSNTEALAETIDRAIDLQTNTDIKLRLLRVSTPFYPELRVGKNGDATKRLQQRLIDLGFLQGSADGYFGEQTKAAVTELQNFVRELEQELIDARPQAASTAATVETPEPTQSADFTFETEEEITDAEPIGPQPQTLANGVADAMLQAYLYSDSFPVVRKTLQTGDSGVDVQRLQRRLCVLGCSAQSADGSYGASTARAVYVFQYYNGLSKTGIADEATQRLLYSDDARQPEYEILSEGSTGEAVEKLQTRLKELGFTNASADGEYGENTKKAIRTLQTYMRDREISVLQAYYGTGADIDDKITIAVNGIADSLLLEEFYSEDFPAIPPQLQNGAECDDVARVQRRLSGLEYFEGTIDGEYGSLTEAAITRFQKQHGLTQTGIADTQTLTVLFSGDAKKAMKPYLLKVSTDEQRVYVYGLDDDGEYYSLVKTMKCSTGKDSTPTPKGTYTSTTGPGARWHYFEKFNCWAQYAFYIDGDIMFHSVLFSQQGGSATKSSVRNLGRKASHGCVRLSVEDAKWIYENCPKNTTVIVY